MNDFEATLKALSKQAKAQARVHEEKMAQLKRQQAEEVDFAKEMKGVQPLKKSGQRYEAPRDLSPIKPRPKAESELDENNYFFVGDSEWQDVPATFSKNGQGQNDIRRLQSGYYQVVADVDLHGYTQEQAQEVLNEFIEFLAKRGVCGEIIHGSGLSSAGYKPKLKNTVRRWLMQHPDVLAYAEPHKGNDGSVFILIKRKRRDEQF